MAQDPLSPVDLNQGLTAILAALDEKSSAAVRSVVTRTASFTIDEAVDARIFLVDATAAPVTVTLPAPSGLAGSGDPTVIVKKIDVSANAVTVETPGAGTIDGAADDTLGAQWDVERYSTDGTDFFKV